MRLGTFRKMLVFAACALFLAAALLSTAFVLAHAHHEHDHDGPDGSCATCVHLTVAGGLLKLAAGALACAACGPGAFAAVRLTVRAVDFRAAIFTLVRQKIELNI